MFSFLCIAFVAGWYIGTIHTNWYYSQVRLGPSS